MYLSVGEVANIGQTGDITLGFKMLEPGLVRCIPENLPIQIQIGLFSCT